MLNPKNIQSIHCTLYVLAMKELLNPAITDNLNKTKIHQFTEQKNVVYRSFRFHRRIFIKWWRWTADRGELVTSTPVQCWSPTKYFHGLLTLLLNRFSSVFLSCELNTLYVFVAKGKLVEPPCKRDWLLYNYSCPRGLLGKKLLYTLAGFCNHIPLISNFLV